MSRPTKLTTLPAKMGPWRSSESSLSTFSAPGWPALKVFGTASDFDHTAYASLAAGIELPKQLRDVSVRRKFVTTLTFQFKTGDETKKKYKLSAFDAARNELYECEYLDPPHGAGSHASCIGALRSFVPARAKVD